MRIVIKPRPLELELFCSEQIRESTLYSLLSWLNAVIAICVKKMNQPVRTSQTSATNIQDFRLRLQSFVDQSHKLPVAGVGKALGGNTEKTRLKHHVFRAFLYSGHKPALDSSQ